MSNSKSVTTHLVIEVSIFYSQGTGQYLARVNTSSSSSANPFILSNMANLNQELKDLQEGIGRSLQRDNFSSTEGLDRPKIFGERLFKALFSGKALELYQACRQQLNSSNQIDQRLVIKINPTTPMLAKLPWELLYDAKSNGYLAFDRRTPIIRFISDCPPRGKTFHSEWRILLVAANSPGTATLDLLGEIKNIKKAFDEVAPQLNLKIKDLLSPSPRDFQRTLHDFDPHIFHFIGHSRAGHLANLVSTLQNLPSLRLAFLNACEMSASEAEQNLELAYTLSRAGIPAVVANQFPALNEATQEMSNEFYRVLAAGRPIEEATLWGRISVQSFRSLVQPTIEWATPILYLQAPDGHLFDDLLEWQQKATTEVVQPQTSSLFQLQIIEIEAKVLIGIYGERIQALQKMRTIHYRNLNRLQEQAAKWGSLNVPLPISSQLDDEREAIQQIEAELNTLLHQAQTELALSTSTQETQAPDEPHADLPDLAVLYTEAQQALDHKQWPKAIDLFQRIVRIDVSYQAANTQLQIALRYWQGQTALQERDWAKAVEHFGHIQSLVPNFHDVPQKSAVAQQQLRWDKLYDEGMAYLELKDWDNAIEALQQAEPDDHHRRHLKRDLGYAQAQQAYTYALQQAQTAEDRLSDWDKVIKLLDPIVATSTAYQTVADSILREARQQVTWLTLYEEGQAYYRAENWVEALRVFEAINREKLDYRDVAQLLQKTHKQQRLVEHYTRGYQYIQAKNWRAARDEFQAILKINLGDSQATRVLAQIEEEIRLADLYDQAQQNYQNGQWNEAIAKLEQLVAVAREYDEGKAASRLETWKKVNLARVLYRQGMAYVNNQEWLAAIGCFEQLQQTGLEEYADAAIELEKARLELKLADLYQQAVQWLQDSQWDRAIATLKEIKRLRPDEQKVDTLLVQAEAGQLQTWYEEAYQYQIKEQWVEAIRLLETLQQRKPGYQDITGRLAKVRQQKQLAEWYEDASQALAAENWSQAIELLEKIEELRPAGYKDSVERYDQAKQNQHLHKRYTQAKEALNGADLDRAEQIFQTIDRSYRDVEQQLLQIGQTKQLISLYQQAQEAAAAHNWVEAIERYTQILRIQNDYRDVQRLLIEARERQRQTELDHAAERAITENNWSLALAYLRELQAARPDDAKVKARLEEVEKLNQIDGLLQAACQLESQNDWAGALHRYRLVLRLDPNQRDIADKVAKLTKSLELEDLYQRALIALDKSNYADAIPWLQSIVDTKADFKNADYLLTQANRQADLSALYQRGHSAYQYHDWATAVECFEKIQTIESDYQDVSPQLAYARQQLNWDNQYKLGLTYIQEGNWDKAIEVLVQVEPDNGRRQNQPRELVYAQAKQAYTQAEHQASRWIDHQADWEDVIKLLQPIYDQNPGYRDVARLIHEAGRQVKLTNLYTEAKQSIEAKKWSVAIKAYQAILSEQPSYRDAVQQLEIAHKQQQLAEHYQKTQQYVANQHWFEAQKELEAILELDPTCSDASDLLEQVTTELELAKLYQQALDEYQNDNLEAAIVNLARVVMKAPSYDNDQAKLLLQHYEKENKIRKAYQNGLTALKNQEWDNAIKLFEKSTGFLDAAVKLEEARLEQRLKELYTKAKQLYGSEQWDEAIVCLEEIQTRRESYEDVSDLLKQADEERWLKTQYLQARQYQAAQDWDKAITNLEAIRRRNPDYADMEALLKEIKQQKQLSDWYTEAQRALATQDWDKAVTLLQNLRDSNEKTFENVELLYQQSKQKKELSQLYHQASSALVEADLDTAEKYLTSASNLDSGYLDVKIKLAEVRRQQRLRKLYAEAQAAFEAQELDMAINAYRQVVDIDPNYENAAVQLDQAERIKNAAAHKLARINELWQGAIQCETKEDLPGALERYQAILDLDPKFNDVIAKVEELKEAIELKGLYQKALTAIQEGHFVGGIPQLQQLIARKPDYKDVQVQLEKAINDHYITLLQRFHYAEHLEKREQYKEAQKQYQLYRQEQEKSPWLSTD